MLLPQGPPLPQAVDRAVARALRDDVLEGGLDRPPVRPDDLKGLGGVIGGALEWLREQYLALLAAMDRLYGTNPILYWVVLGGLMLILAGILWHIVWTFRRVFRAADQPPPAAAGLDAAGRLKHYRDLLEQARGEARSGSHRDAVRTLNLALLALCEENAALRFARSLTLREILGAVQRRLRGGPLDGQEVLAYGRRTEAVVWGLGSMDHGDYQRLETDAMRIADAVRAGAAIGRRGRTR